MKLPNYNLLRYELDDNHVKDDIGLIKSFYRRVFDSCSNDREAIFNWFMTLSDKQLSDIGIKKIVSHHEIVDNDTYTRFGTICVVKMMPNNQLRIMSSSTISSKYESGDRLEYRILASLL